MATPLGLHSPRLATVRALLTKAGRREQGRFAVDGATLLAEALAAGVEPEAVYVSESAAGVFDAATRRRVEDRLFVVPERAMAKLSDLETPPGLVSTFRLPARTLEEALSSGESAAVLAGISDPGNAGTLLRTAEIFGLRAAVFTPEAVEPQNPKVVRATMGAIFRLPVVVASGDDILRVARDLGYSVVAADRSGEPLPGFRFPERCLIAVGNERRGVAGSLKSWDSAVAVPQDGAGESLNAAVAGGIIFYAFSQRAQVGSPHPPSREKP